MLHAHRKNTTAGARRPEVVVDRLDRAPGGRAVVRLDTEDGLAFAFGEGEITKTGAAQLQALLQDALDSGILEMRRGRVETQPQQHRQAS